MGNLCIKCNTIHIFFFITLLHELICIYKKTNIYNNAITFTKNNDFKLSNGTKHVHQSKLYLEHAHWRKGFLQLLLLKVCESFLLRQSKKTCSVLWSVWASFAFLQRRRSNKYCFEEVKLISYIQLLSLMCQSANLVWNIVV